MQSDAFTFWFLACWTMLGTIFTILSFGLAVLLPFRDQRKYTSKSGGSSQELTRKSSRLSSGNTLRTENVSAEDMAANELENKLEHV
jgi:hypothetical protein